MTTITKEWLQQTIAEFENTRDDIPFGLSDDDAKILIVLKRALVSLDAEPVRYLNKFSGTCVTLEQQSNAADDVAVYMPLYAAPPAPVVPEEAYSDDCPDLYASQPEAWAAGWNACRTALLQGAEPVSHTYKLNELSGNSPVTQDGWISCSERMPEQGAYISAVSKHGEYVAGQVIDDWLDLHDGTSFGLDEVYLWMMLPPLPASPQQ
ncbi:DUF551 domain-containing protein [Salmonella enterica subsp. salamae]|nr:DUF551 domain-containing protein [Salmonella enterica subsp. salamae serovar Sofia]